MSDDAGSESPSMTEHCRHVLDLVLADQERHWRAGNPMLVEKFLEREPALRNDPDAILDLIYKEILLRSNCGEKPTLEEYIQRFPDLAATLGPIFEVHQAFESDQDWTVSFPQNDRTLRVPFQDLPTTPPDVPGYELLERLGQGGMGVVYKARQKSLDRIVALKMVLAGAHANADELARFRREAEVVARFAHPNIVQIHEVGEHDGRPYLSLEFVEGGSLDKKLAGTPIPARDAARLVEILARASHHAHLQGVIHRDLKPANVLLTADGTPKITDFGLARFGAGSGQTRSGDILGTPSYMAPEQAAGRVAMIGPATDIYALGAILYELLTGRPPFRAENAMETLLHVLNQEPVSVRRLQPNVPGDLETICLKCLDKVPGHRYTSAEALADDLRRFIDGHPIHARPTPAWERGLKWARRRPALAGLYALAVVAAVVLGIYSVLLRDALTEAETQRNAAQQAQSQAETAAEQRRLQLVQARLADGSRLLDEGDWFAALLPFAEALRLDQEDAKRAEIHRVRLSVILRQCPRLVQFWPHGGEVIHTDFSADGRRVLTVSGNQARLLDASDGAETVPSMIHGKLITFAALSSDGRWLATVADDQTVQIWDATTGQPHGSPLKLSDGIVRVAFGANDRILTATRNATYDARIQVWEISNGKPALKPLTMATAPLSDIAFSPDGRLAATADMVSTKGVYRGVLTVWDIAAVKAAFTARNVPAAITQIRFSPNASWVMAAVADGTVRIWDCKTGNETAQVRQGAPLLHLAFSPDSQRLATAGLDGLVHIWSVAGKKLVTLRHGPAFTHAVNYVAFSPDGLHVVTAGADNTARIWDATAGTPMAPPLRHGDKVTRASFGHDGRLVVTTSADRAVRLWNLASGKWSTPPLEHEANVTYASLDHDGRRAVTAGSDRIARLWDLSSGHSSGSPLKHAHPLTFAGFTANGRVATTGEDNAAGTGEASVWDPSSGKRLFHRTTAERILGVPDTDPTVRRAWFSSDGRLLLTVNGAGTAQIWNTDTGQSFPGTLEHKSAVTGASFSPDGRYVLTETFLPPFTVRALLASGESPAALGRIMQLIHPASMVTVWEVASGKQVASIGPWSESTLLSFRRADFSPDGRSILLVSDGEARLWDIAERRMIQTFRKPGTGVANAALSQDGRTLTTASEDDSAQLWNAASGEMVPTPAWFRHGGEGWPPLFSPDGRLLVLSSRPAGVRIWDAATGDPISPMLAHPGQVSSVAFSFDGQLLLTASDRAARAWSLRADERSANDWLQLAQLLSCSRMHPERGHPVSLLPDELGAAWKELRRTSASAFETEPRDVISWHAEMARVCEKNGQWKASLVHFNRLVELDPERLDVFARRGRAHAEVGQWDRAAADFEKATSFANAKPGHWYRHALLRLYLNEVDKYRQVCAAMLDRFESSGDLTAAQLAAWTGLLAPSSQAEADRLVAVAERAVKASPRNHARLLTLGAALFRAGRYEDAVQKLDEAVKVWGKEETTWEWFFLAMAHHYLGHSELAKANFDRAVRWMDQRQVKGADGMLRSTLFWSDKLELTLLRREAERYLRASPEELRNANKKASQK